MVIVGFQVQNKFGKARFFKETFLVADISVEVVFGMPFLTFSKVEVNFAIKEPIWKAYTITEALFNTKKVQIIDSKKFAKAMLNSKQEAFVVYIATLLVELMKMHPNRKVQIVTLIADGAYVTIRQSIWILLISILKNPPWCYQSILRSTPMPLI